MKMSLLQVFRSPYWRTFPHSREGENCWVLDPSYLEKPNSLGTRLSEAVLFNIAHYI